MPRSDSSSNSFNPFIQLNFCENGKMIFLSGPCYANILPKEQAKIIIKQLSAFYSLSTKTIDNYRKQLVDELEEAMNASYRSVKNKKQPTPGFIYFILIGNNHIKIGRTKHLSQRVNQLTPKLHSKTTLLGHLKVSDMKQAEAILHDYFSKRNSNGEWFRLTHKQLLRTKFPTELNKLIIENNLVIENA